MRTLICEALTKDKKNYYGGGAVEPLVLGQNNEDKVHAGVSAIAAPNRVAN